MKPLAPPIAPSSVYHLADLDELEALYAGAPGFIYSRDAHPNGVELVTAINVLQGAKNGIVTGSGMAALAAAFLATCKPGDRLVAADQLYGRTFKLLDHFQRLGIQLEFANIYDDAALKRALVQPAAAMLIETISNPLMNAIDISRIADLAHAANAKLIVDNTFAGPTRMKPLELGADFVMESLSKIMNGHSDVMLGYLGAKQDVNLADLAGTWGFFASPFDCWLVLRGLSTLALRMDASEANARRLVDELKTKVRVHYPGFGNMLSFELADRDAANQFLRTSGIPFCPSLGHHETTASYPWSTSHRAVNDAEKLRLGITPGLVRLSVGCEPLEELLKKIATSIP